MRKSQELPWKQDPCSTSQPCPRDRPAASWLGEAAWPSPTHGTWSPAQQLSCTQAFPMGLTGLRLGGGVLLGDPAVQCLEWQILQPGAQDRSPSPSLSYTPGTLAW